jgi:hypothetical protein
MHMHPMQIEFLANERISRIAHEAKEERWRQGVKATGQVKVGRLLPGMLQPELRGLTIPKPQEQCC